MNRPFSLVVSSALVVLSGACGNPPNFLDGSVKTSHDLTFDRVEMRYLSDQKVYQLSYFESLDDAGGSSDTVAKVTFNEPEGGVVVDEPIDITSEAADGRVERVTAAGDVFPAVMRSGLVTFHSEAVVGETSTGEFAVTFDNGQTLDGTWEVELTEASF